MSPEEAQLYTDMVKIGLPVLGTVLAGAVAAWSSVWVTRMRTNYERAKEARERQSQLLHQIATDVAEFEHIAGVHAMTLGNEIRGLDNPIRSSAETQRELETGNKPIRDARANLKLLGLKDEEESLEEYVENVRELLRHGHKLSEQRAKELAEIIPRGPEEFYQSLSHVYLTNQ